MKKSITKEQIIETVLRLLEEKGTMQSVNLREIARVLGCAHTNLYNYFPTFASLLWEAHMEIQTRFVGQIARELEAMQDHACKLHRFYFSLSALYLEHRGWFRLAWLDHIHDMRPKEHQAATEAAVNAMVEILVDIWFGLYAQAPSRERIHSVLHDVHCYIIGEVSNFINGRGRIQDSETLKQHIAETAVTFFTLALREGTYEQL